MVWALLPLLFFSFILGIIALERDLASIKPPAAPETAGAQTVAREFMAYRNAVIAYAETKMGSNSYPNAPVSLADLQTVGYSGPVPAGASNMITDPEVESGITPSMEASNNHGYYVCVWMPVPQTEISQIALELGGDLTIGTVLSGGVTWQQAGPQGQALPIPITCLDGMNPMTGAPDPLPPPGDMISVVGITENSPS